MSQKSIASNISNSELTIEDEQLEEIRNQYQKLIGNPKKTKNTSTKIGKKEENKMKRIFYEKNREPLTKDVKNNLIQKFGKVTGQAYIEKKEKNGDLDKYVNNILDKEWKDIITHQRNLKKMELHEAEKRRQSHVSEIKRALRSHTPTPPSPAKNSVSQYRNMPPPMYEATRRQRPRGGNKTHKRKTRKQKTY